MVRAAAFCNRSDWELQQAQAKTKAATPVTTPQPDFHEIIGHLGDHPNVLRRLGLLFDLVFDMPSWITLDAISVRIAPTTAIDGVATDDFWSLRTECVIVKDQGL